MTISFDIIIPVYNEKLETVLQTISSLTKATKDNFKTSIIVVNDGSDISYNLEELAAIEHVTYISHDSNRGYGAALKTGILSGTAPYIAIIDADGTYPPEELPDLAKEIKNYDMVIGVRTGPVSQIPPLRRFPKKMLNLFASYMSGENIPDLNSGMRIFSRDLCYYLWGFFPQGFSFTSTITMGAIMGGFRIKNIPINYYKRSGQSSIRPIRDTIHFFRLVARLGLIFYPTKLFTPIAGILMLCGFLKAAFRDFWHMGTIGTTSQTLMLAGLEIFMIGLVANLIVHNRSFGLQKPLTNRNLPHSDNKRSQIDDEENNA
jgi:glycosyltransferase involved in cell wall biosynthesis